MFDIIRDRMAHVSPAPPPPLPSLTCTLGPMATTVPRSLPYAALAAPHRRLLRPRSHHPLPWPWDVAHTVGENQIPTLGRTVATDYLGSWMTWSRLTKVRSSKVDPYKIFHARAADGKVPLAKSSLIPSQTWYFKGLHPTSCLLLIEVLGSLVLVLFGVTWSVWFWFLLLDHPLPSPLLGLGGSPAGRQECLPLWHSDWDNVL